MSPKSMKVLVSALKSFSLSATLHKQRNTKTTDAFGDDEPQDECYVEPGPQKQDPPIEILSATIGESIVEANSSLPANGNPTVLAADSAENFGQKSSCGESQGVGKRVFTDERHQLAFQPGASNLLAKPTVNARKRASKEKSKAFRSAKRTAASGQRRAISSNSSPGCQVGERSYVPSSKHRPRSSVSQKYTNPLVFHIHEANLRDRSCKTAWIGLRLPREHAEPPTLHQLKQQNFKLHRADPSRDQVFVDSQGFIALVIVPPPSEKAPDEGEPKKESWEDCIEGGASSFGKAFNICKGLKVKDNTRGPLCVLNAGINHHNGTTHPVNRKFNTEAEKAAARLLLNDPRLRRVAGFQNAMLHLFAPKLAKYYDDTLGKLYNRDPLLLRPFDTSVYPSVAFNIDPKTVCRDHTDAGNFPSNLCAITTFGNYNYKLGGHLILYDLKLVIEIPPGYTVFIPSAALRHGNTPVAEGETRHSMVQYCPGGLLRWVAYGFMNVGVLENSEGGLEKRNAIDGNSEERWNEVINLLSKINELKDDLAKCRVSYT